MSDSLGPQFHQLPLLMTPEEVGSLNTRDWPGKKISDVPHLFKMGLGHREHHRDEATVKVLRDRIEESGYDDRFPVQIRLERGHEPFVHEGHHRAVAAMQTGVLLPVVHDTGREALDLERERQHKHWLGDRSVQ